uniref:Putative ovule protein n=1 Tax=Solanum chacoense TaxID=4108 RepID=A0A0V0GQE9_SOLCH
MMFHKLLPTIMKPNHFTILLHAHRPEIISGNNNLDGIKEFISMFLDKFVWQPKLTIVNYRGLNNDVETSSRVGVGARFHHHAACTERFPGWPVFLPFLAKIKGTICSYPFNI